MFTSYLLCWVRRNHFLLLLSKSPNGAILLHSPGRKPWVNRFPHLLSPVGAAQPQRKANTHAVSAAPKGAHSSFGPCVPKVPYRALPSFHPGLCRSVALAGLVCRNIEPKGAWFHYACPRLISCIALQWSHTNSNHKLTYCLKNQLFCTKTQT